MKRFLVMSVATALMLSACSMAPYSVKRHGNYISFHAKIPQAKNVYFVSNLTNFQKVKAKMESKGVWESTLPYKGGIIKYFYIADGKIYLPPCKSYVKDGFGGKDCVYLPTM